MKPEETIDFNLRWTWLNIARYYNDAAARYESSMSVGMVLLNIDVENGTPSTQLGPKSISHLTPLAFEKREVAKKVVVDFNETVKRKLKDTDIQTFLKVLSIVNKTIEEKALEESTS